MANPPNAPISVDSILLTEELARRPPRPPNFFKESQALLSLTKVSR